MKIKLAIAVLILSLTSFANAGVLAQIRAQEAAKGYVEMAPSYVDYFHYDTATATWGTSNRRLAEHEEMYWDWPGDMDVIGVYANGTFKAEWWWGPYEADAFKLNSLDQPSVHGTWSAGDGVTQILVFVPEY